MSVNKPEIDLGNQQLRSKVLLTLSLLILCSCLVTGIHNISSDNMTSHWVAASQLSFASFFVYTSINIFRGKQKPWFNVTIVYAYIALIAFAVVTFGVQKSATMWLFSIPVVSYFILSRIHSFMLSVLVLIFISYLRIDYNLYEAGITWNNALINIILPYALIMVMANLYEKVRLQNEWELSEYALTDPLTGCYNRLALKSVYPNLQAAQQNMAILLIDIDHFKQVNDSYGHEAGDQVLKMLSTLLIDTLGEKHVYRIGGEEFLVFLKGDLTQCKAQAESIRKKVQNLDFYYDKQRVSLTFSGGFKRFVSEDALQDVLKEADNALYRAKSQGRNQILYV